MKLKALIIGSIIVLVLSTSCEGLFNIKHPNPNLTGYWSVVNTTTSTTNPNVFAVDGSTFADFHILDTDGRITISEFFIWGSVIGWNTGSGSFDGTAFKGSIAGTYTNTYLQTVDISITINAEIDSTGKAVSGKFSQTNSVGGSSVSCTGTIMGIKY